jgi:hypothetical protein
MHRNMSLLANGRQVDIILDIAREGMVESVQKARETQQPNRPSCAHVQYTLEALAEIFLTEGQQRQVEEILKMHDWCLYPCLYGQAMAELGDGRNQ